MKAGAGSGGGAVQKDATPAKTTKRWNAAVRLRVSRVRVREGQGVDGIPLVRCSYREAGEVRPLGFAWTGRHFETTTGTWFGREGLADRAAGGAAKALEMANKSITCASLSAREEDG